MQLKNLPFLFIIILTAINSHGAFFAIDKTRDCNQTVLRVLNRPKAKKHITMHQGESYNVQSTGSSMVETLQYKRTYTKGDTDYLEFSRKSKGEAITLKLEDIFDLRQIHKKNNSSGGPPSILRMLAQALHTIGWSMIVPYTRLLSSRGVEVLGVPGNLSDNSRELAEKIANNIHDFDHTMTSLGWEKPSSTRVVVAANSRYPGLPPGPFCATPPIRNIWRKKCDNMIFMTSNQYQHQQNSRMVRSASVLLHERAHSFFGKNYGKNYNDETYIRRNSMFNEALADFSAAHHLNDPGIMKGIISDEDGTPLRDIKERFTLFVLSETDEKIHTILQASRDNYHYDSLFFSNVLWRIREYIGEDKIAQIYKPFVDNLNRYHHDHKQHLKRVRKTYSDNETLLSSLTFKLNAAQYLLTHFEYFLAVLKKTVQETTEHSKVEEVVDEVVAEFGLNPDSINSIYKTLGTNQNNSFDQNIKSIEFSVFMHTAGVIAILTEGALVAIGFYLIFLMFQLVLGG